MEYTVNFLWDDDAQVWVATSDDIPGLVLEGGSIDALFERVKYAAPEIPEPERCSESESVVVPP